MAPNYQKPGHAGTIRKAGPGSQCLGAVGESVVSVRSVASDAAVAPSTGFRGASAADPHTAGRVNFDGASKSF